MTSFEHALYVVGNVLLLAAIPPANLFVLLYRWRSRWYETLSGKSLMYVFVAISLVLDQVALSVWIGPDYPGRFWIRIGLYGAIAITFWRMLFVLIHIQSRKELFVLPGDFTILPAITKNRKQRRKDRTSSYE